MRVSRVSVTAARQGDEGYLRRSHARGPGRESLALGESWFVRRLDNGATACESELVSGRVTKHRCRTTLRCVRLLLHFFSSHGLAASHTSARDRQ